MLLFEKPLRLVILDIDGVITDLFSKWLDNYTEAALKAGFPLGPVKKYFDLAMNGKIRWSASAHEGARDVWPGISDEDIERLIILYREQENINPYPAIQGSVETIKWLRSEGLSLAICTTNDADTAEKRLRGVGIKLDWFQASTTWESGYRKPDPRALTAILGSTRTDKNHAVYIGDWLSDLETARNADIEFIAVLTGLVPKQEFIKYGVAKKCVVKSLAEFPKLLRKE